MFHLLKIRSININIHLDSLAVNVYIHSHQTITECRSVANSQNGKRFAKIVNFPHIYFAAVLKCEPKGNNKCCVKVTPSGLSKLC